MQTNSPKSVTASEIAEYVYCPEAWRLGVTGHKSANQPRLELGTAHHAEKASAERVVGGSIALSRVLIILAILALALAVLWQ